MNILLARLSRPAQVHVGVVGGVPIRSSRLALGTFGGWGTTSRIVGAIYFSAHIGTSAVRTSANRFRSPPTNRQFRPRPTSHSGTEQR
jgi:hypothetical protein